MRGMDDGPGKAVVLEDPEIRLGDPLQHLPRRRTWSASSAVSVETLETCTFIPCACFSTH